MTRLSHWSPEWGQDAATFDQRHAMAVERLRELGLERPDRPQAFVLVVPAPPADDAGPGITAMIGADDPTNLLLILELAHESLGLALERARQELSDEGGE